MNDKADFTQGSILKKLIAFMMPVLGALILQEFSFRINFCTFSYLVEKQSLYNEAADLLIQISVSSPD